jgi:GT2 family glycosyltransferase
VTRTVPLVGAVVVNYDGGEMTTTCVASLLASEWPSESLRVVLVDNASSDGITDRVERDWPMVHVVRNSENLGFAGGCNSGIRELGDADYVALVNNDATVEPGWLAPLVAALVDDPELGAACPKILFAGEYRELTLRVPTHRRGRGDRRDLGLRLGGARVGGADVTARMQLVEGFWGREPVDRAGDGQWTSAQATVRLPADQGTRTAQLLLGSDATPTANVMSGAITSGAATTDLEVPTTPAWCDASLDGPLLRVINNVGSVLTADGYGADRGFQAPDDGQFEEAQDVFAWCGAGVLLRRAHLDDIGLFDERLFLYYEDLELAWRGSARGWRYRYVPESIVHHLHAASTIEGSAFKDRFNERNRLLVLTRHARAADVWRAIARYLITTGSYAKRDLLARALHGRLPRTIFVSRRLRAFGAFVVRAPGALRSRRRDRRDGAQPLRIRPRSR